MFKLEIEKVNQNKDLLLICQYDNMNLGENMKKIIIIGIITVLLIIILPEHKYNNEDFNIETYISSIDKDNDNIDDQTDILNNAKKYIKTKPKYKSKYYETGYPNDEYGVCTDVVGFALTEAGYDLMTLVNEDVKLHKERYNIKIIDKNIDFRRVNNLNIYFKYNSISLTLNPKEISSWQGGDIVVFKKHIGIVSDKRNSNGINYVIHHAHPFQINYEEDILENYEIIGHYRIS